MKTLTQYGRMAEQHWRQFLPKMVADLEAKGQLRPMLLEAEEKTENELDSLLRALVEEHFPHAVKIVLVQDNLTPMPLLRSTRPSSRGPRAECWSALNSTTPPPATCSQPDVSNLAWTSQL